MRITCAPQQQHQAAACRPWAKKRSEDSAGGNYSAQQFGLEELRHQVGHRHWSPAQHAVKILLAQFSQRASGLQHAPQVALAGIVNIRWRELQRLANDAADLLE